MKHIFYIFALLFLVACSEKIDNPNNNESEDIATDYGDYAGTNGDSVYDRAFYYIDYRLE